MELNSLALTLRSRDKLPSGLAPVGPLRDWQAEQRRALAKATANALADTKVERKHEWTAFKRGEASEAYSSLKRAKPLPIVLKPPTAAKPSDSQRQRRLAAASRWQKARLTLALSTGSDAPLEPQPVQVVQQPSVRHVRRGEFELIQSSYRQYTDTELLDLVYKVTDKKLKTSELAKLYEDGDIRVPNKAVEKILYPKTEREAKIRKLETDGLVPLGGPRQVQLACVAGRLLPPSPPASAVPVHHPPPPPTLPPPFRRCLPKTWSTARSASIRRFRTPTRTSPTRVLR